MLKNKISIIIFSVIFSILIWGSITLSEEYFSYKEFNIKVINPPSGYTCSIINPSNVSVKIKGQGWQLLSLIVGSQTDYFVSADNDSGNLKLDPFNEISENTWIGSRFNVVEITPKIVSFYVEKIKFKKLKVEPDTNLTFSDGYGLASPIKIYPDSIVVAGPQTILEKKSSIKTDLVSLSSLDKRMKIIADIKDVQGIRTERNKVELTFDVQRIVEKSFKDIKVEITDIPDDRNIILIPNTIECSLRGGINILGKITPDQISASVKYSAIVYDTLGNIQPEVNLLENTQVVFIKPARLSYVIKKFDK
jgi:hypothetical protein